jgi:hypothetical protein
MIKAITITTKASIPGYKIPGIGPFQNDPSKEQ